MPDYFSEFYNGFVFLSNICIRIYVHIYGYMSKYIPTHNMYIGLQTYIYTPLCVCVRMCILARAHTRAHAHTFTCRKMLPLHVQRDPKEFKTQDSWHQPMERHDT